MPGPAAWGLAGAVPRAANDAANDDAYDSYNGDDPGEDDPWSYRESSSVYFLVSESVARLLGAVDAPPADGKN